MKRKTNISVKNAQGYHVTAYMEVGPDSGYTSGDILDANATVQLIGQSLTNSQLLPSTYVIGPDNNLYQLKDNSYYPVSHPDLSTQPSILPQRFGNLDIKEVLIAPGRENEIPENATILEAFSFNKNQCVAAYCEKNAVVTTETKKVYTINISGVPVTVETDINEGDLFSDCIGKTLLKLTWNPLYGSATISYPVSTSYRDAKFTIAMNESEYNFIISASGHGDYYLSDETGTNYCVLHMIDGSGSVAFTIENVIDTQIYYTLRNMTIVDTDSNFIEIKSTEIKKEQKKGWYISNDKGVIPDFTLVRYVGDDKGYYYYDDVKDSNESLPEYYRIPLILDQSSYFLPLSILTSSDNRYNHPIPDIHAYIVGRIITSQGTYYLATYIVGDLWRIYDDNLQYVSACNVLDDTLNIGSIDQIGDNAIFELFDTRPEAAKRLLFNSNGSINGLNYSALDVTQDPEVGDSIGRLYNPSVGLYELIVTKTNQYNISTSGGLTILKTSENSTYTARLTESGVRVYVYLYPRLGTK